MSWLPSVTAPCVLLSAALASAQSRVPTAAQRSVVATERAFAALAADGGTRAAFLAYLAENSVVFEPDPVDARSVYERRTPTADRLEWQPALAGVAAAGDLAFTSGPWRLRPDGTSGERDLYGHYLTVWRPDPSGVWKVIADIGITHGGADWPAAVTYLQPEVPAASGGTGPQWSRADVLELDRRFGDEVGDVGLRRAYRRRLAETALLYRPGHLPLSPGAAERLLDEPGANWMWRTYGGGVSRSGDLAYSYGQAQRTSVDGVSDDSFSYLRVWTHGASWRILLDVVIPAGAAER